MNVSFTIMAHGLEKAGKIEKALKEIGVPYEAKEAKPCSANGKRRKGSGFGKTSKAQVLAVTNELARNPDWTYTAIGKECGVHEQTVSKIANGIHPIQTREAK